MIFFQFRSQIFHVSNYFNSASCINISSLLLVLFLFIKAWVLLSVSEPNFIHISTPFFTSQPCFLNCNPFLYITTMLYTSQSWHLHHNLALFIATLLYTSHSQPCSIHHNPGIYITILLFSSLYITFTTMLYTSHSCSWVCPSIRFLDPPLTPPAVNFVQDHLFFIFLLFRVRLG